MLKTVIANLSAGFGPRKTALVVVGLVVGIAAIIGGAAASGVMVATEVTKPQPAEARTGQVIADTPDAVAPVAARLARLERQVELVNLQGRWDYEIAQLLTCVGDIDPNPDDYGPDLGSWRAQLRASGGAQTLGTFIPNGPGLHFIGIQPSNGPGTVALNVGRAYQMRAQERSAGVTTPWSEWSEWRSCGVLLPRYPEQPGQLTWLQAPRPVE